MLLTQGEPLSQIAHRESTPTPGTRGRDTVRRAAALAIAGMALIGAACSGGGDVAEPEWTSAHESADWWMSVAAPTDTDRWIAGGTAEVGALLRVAGGAVERVSPDADVGLLNWIHAFSPSDMIVVGNAGAVLRGDGTTWAQVAVPTDLDLWGVWGASPSDVWAVGGDAMAGPPIVLRDTGGGFEPVELPPLGAGVGTFFKVWGSAADDVYVIGQRGAVLHWDGTALRTVDVGVADDLIGIWGTSADRIALVGGRATGAAALWDGSSWRQPDLSGFPGLNGVWFDGDIVHVVGVAGSAGTLGFGSAEVTSRYTIDTPVFLHAIIGSPSGALTTVGGDFSMGMAGPFLGEVFTAGSSNE